jgi:hypothetical protein
MDVKYIKKKIEHRLTSPFTPKTIRMVERVNGTNKNNTIHKNQYENPFETNQDLAKSP